LRQTRSIANALKTITGVNRGVTVLFQSKYYVLSGNWHWNFHTENIFCSDVILSLSPDNQATHGIIHPDDITTIQKQLTQPQIEIPEISFRIISTNGMVHTIDGYEVRIDEVKDATTELTALVEHSTIEEKELSVLRLMREVYATTEKITDTGVWFYNASTFETWYSDHVFRLHGMPPQSLNSHFHTFLGFIHPAEREQTHEFIETAYKKRVPLHIDYTIVTGKGEKIIRYISSWKFNEKGEAILSGSFQDVTEQKQKEKKLEDTESIEHFHRQLLHFDEQYANLGHWQVNLMTRKLSFTDNFFRLFGLKQQALPSGIKTVTNYLHPDDRDAFMVAIKKMFNEHKTPDMYFRVLRSDGKMRFIQQSGKLVSIGAELVMSCTIRDVTILKGLEKKITDLNQEVFLKNFVNKEYDSVKGSGSWIWNLQSGEVSWSDGIYALLGMKPGTVQLSQKRLLMLVHPADKKRFTDELTLVFQQRQDVEFTFRGVEKGEIKYMKAVFRIAKFNDNEFFIGQLLNINKETVLQNELLQRMQLAESLSENILDRIIITDINNNILLWNKNCEDAYGVKKESALGRNFFDVFPKLKNEDEISLFHRVLKGESVTLNDQKSINEKGYYDIHMMPLWSSEEVEVTGIIHIIHDTTKEFQLRQRLNERLSFIESMVDSSVDRIIVLDRNMCYLVWNKKCELTYGIKKEDVLGKNVLEVFPGWQNEIAYTHFRNALKGETIHLPPAPEKGRDYEVYLIPVKMQNDEISAVLWVMHDFHLETELQLQKTKNIQLLNSLNEHYMELDRDYRFIFMNTSAEGFFNLKNEDVWGRTIWEVFPQLANTKVKEAIITAMEESLPIRSEFVSPTKGISVFASLTPTPDGLSLLFIDIEEEKEKERKLKEREDLIAQVTYATPDAITIYDLEIKQPDYLNDRLAVWLGYTNDELLNLGVKGRRNLFTDKDWKRMVDFNSRMNEAKDEDILTIEYNLFTKSGEQIRIRNRSKVFRRDQDGNVKQMISILQRI
jgi:PAS domain S-box-containing protein